MTCRRRSPGLPGFLAVLGLLASAGLPAFGQDRIPVEIIVAEELSDDQQETITGYVDHWCQRLNGGEDAEVTLARRRLAEPLNQGRATEAFLRAYTEPVQPCLDEAVQSDRMIVRLNAMIVTTDMTGETALPLIRQGVQDENAAVRYWAVKAVRTISTQRSWPSEQERQLLDFLTESLRGEQAGAVVQQLMLSITELDLAEAPGRTLEALNRRIAAHRANPGRAVQAEQAGLRQLFRKLMGGDAGNQTLRQLGRTAYLYMRVAVTQLQAGNVPEQHRDGYTSLVLLADHIMRNTHDALNGTQNLPDPIQSLVQQQQWQQLMVRVDRWQTIMKNPPFNFTDNNLALNVDTE